MMDTKGAKKTSVLIQVQNAVNIALEDLILSNHLSWFLLPQCVIDECQCQLFLSGYVVNLLQEEINPMKILVR